jgi:hypothetical protein
VSRVQQDARESLFLCIPRGAPPLIRMASDAFHALRRDIDRMLSFLGLSQRDVLRTHLGDTDEGGHHEEPDQEQERELLDGDAEQRSEAPVPVLRPEGSDEPGGRRVLPLDSVPVVRLAHGAEGDVEHKLAEGLGPKRSLDGEGASGPSKPSIGTAKPTNQASSSPRYCYPQCRDPWFEECADCWRDGGNSALVDHLPAHLRHCAFDVLTRGDIG